MKRPLALVMGALCAAIMMGTASAQTAGVTITVPAGPAGTIQALVLQAPCGAAGTVSPTATTTLTLPSTCATPGAVVTFASTGVALASTVIVPLSGTGTLVIGSLEPANPVSIVIPAVPSGAGTVSAIVGGRTCATATVSSTATTSMSLPATCVTAGATISFTTPGGALVSTLTVPLTGGATLTLPSLAAVTPVTITLPTGNGILAANVNGQACGATTLGAAVTTLTLPSTCATANGSLTFINAAGQQLATVLAIPASGGAALSIANLDVAVVRVVLPSAPAGSISIMSGNTVCGTGTVSTATTTTVTLSSSCSVPGLPLTFVGGSNVLIASTLTVPGTITTSNGTLALASLAALNPLNVQVPAGTGTLNIFVGGKQCMTSALVSTGTTVVTLPVTCALAGQLITFTINGTPVVPTLTVPASGTGTLVLASLQLVAPTPAKTGNAGIEGNGSASGLMLAGLLAVALGDRK
ncbi:MAG: hypothetical protein EPO65_07275, partial [Dehalococcoidia bacterium]